MIALITGRLLAVLGALLVLLALTWPWRTLKVSSLGMPQELRFSRSGSDISALAAAQVVLAPKLADLLDEVVKFDPSAGRALDGLRAQIAQTRRDGALITAGIAALWVPPLVALVLALTLLVTNGTLRFRRGFGAALGLAALVSIVALVATRMRIEGALDQLRTAPALSDLFDTLEQSGVAISLQPEGGMTSAPLFAALMLLGGLAELALPLHLAARSPALAALPVGVSALQATGAPIALPIVASPVVVEPEGEQRTCVQCGKSLRAEARFCNGCGARQE